MSKTQIMISQGGTGANTAAAALTALGAYPASNPSGFITAAGVVTSVTFANVTSALGYTPVNKAGDTMSGGLTINGALNATTKSFLIEHPTKEGMKLRYGSLEGPENGVYVRGRLKNTNRIELPDYWLGLVNEETITVNLTAVGKKQDLYVQDIRDNCVFIAGEPFDYFYTVFAERKDVEKLIVEE